jgi:hypothetical protein
VEATAYEHQTTKKLFTFWENKEHIKSECLKLKG